MKSSLGCVLAQVISYWPVTVENLFWSQPSVCGIYGGKVALGMVFLRTLQYYYSIITDITVPYFQFSWKLKNFEYFLNVFN